MADVEFQPLQNLDAAQPVLKVCLRCSLWTALILIQRARLSMLNAPSIVVPWLLAYDGPCASSSVSTRSMRITAQGLRLQGAAVGYANSVSSAGVCAAPTLVPARVQRPPGGGYTGFLRVRAASDVQCAACCAAVHCGAERVNQVASQMAMRHKRCTQNTAIRQISAYGELANHEASQRGRKTYSKTVCLSSLRSGTTRASKTETS